MHLSNQMSWGDKKNGPQASSSQYISSSSKGEGTCLRSGTTTSMQAMKSTIVLYPGLLVSHFVPMMQLADAVLEAGYAVAVALIDLTMDEDVALASAVDRVASTKPAVTIHRLPRIQNPPTITDCGGDALLWYFKTVRRYNDRLREFLCSLPPSVVHAVIMDGPSADALDVTKELGVPAYTFYATNASAVAAFLQLPWTYAEAEGQPSFRELGDTPLSISGVPPMPASYLMPSMLDDPASESYKTMMRVMRRNPEPDGILVNTVASLEARVVSALRDPLFLPIGDGGCRRTKPAVYCVGPLVVAAGAVDGETKEKHECVAWLDEQPERSVVFLCFGSLGTATHSAEQLREIAVGLERSGHRFLWVVRAPLPTEGGVDPRTDSDLGALLPAGFLERTKGRGLVVKLWAPQVDVLNHRATGAFVTHCGWNSVMEAITAGVPMLCWPLYAEQKMNSVVMVEEIGVGVDLDGWQRGLVQAEEVERKVRMVMESEEGEQLRARVAAHRDAAAVAWKDGGSSRAAFGQFLSDVDKIWSSANGRNGKLGQS